MAQDQTWEAETTITGCFLSVGPSGLPAARLEAPAMGTEVYIYVELPNPAQAHAAAVHAQVVLAMLLYGAGLDSKAGTAGWRGLLQQMSDTTITALLRGALLGRRVVLLVGDAPPKIVRVLPSPGGAKPLRKMDSMTAPPAGDALTSQVEARTLRKP